MSAIIEIDGHRATIDAGEWACDDPGTLARLQELQLPENLPDAANAHAAVDALKGKIISPEPQEPETDEEGFR